MDRDADVGSSVTAEDDVVNEERYQEALGCFGIVAEDGGGLVCLLVAERGRPLTRKTVVEFAGAESSKRQSRPCPLGLPGPSGFRSVVAPWPGRSHVNIGGRLEAPLRICRAVC